MPARDIFPSNQIKLLGVIVDDALNFIVHAQYVSKGMQALGSLRYLRKGLNGIPPYIARYLAISKILSKMLWASPIGGKVLGAFYTLLKWHIIKLHDGL
jgi:hypothetical protein